MDLRLVIRSDVLINPAALFGLNTIRCIGWSSNRLGTVPFGCRLWLLGIRQVVLEAVIVGP